MKTLTFRFLIGLSLFFIGCQNPLKDFVIGFKEPIEDGTLRIQFSRPENDRVSEGLIFSVVGPSAKHVVSVLNRPSYRINADGVLILAIDPSITPTPEDPIQFSIVAEAEGYLKVVKPVQFTRRNNQSMSIAFLKTNQTGAMFTQQTEITALKELQWMNGQESGSLLLPEHNQYRNREGQELKGERTLALVAYRASSALGRVPGGGAAASPLDASGRPLENPFRLTHIAGMVSLEMSTPAHEMITGFEQPLRLRMDFASNLINPKTGKSLAPGDELEVFSYSPYSGEWRREEVVKAVKSANGKMQVAFDVPHLSYWIVGWSETICAKGPSFRIKSMVSDLDITYLARLVNVRDGSLVKEYYLSLNNGTRSNVTLLPEINDPVQLLIYNYNNYHGGDREKVVGRSMAVAACESSLTEIEVKSVTVPKVLTIELDNRCPGGGTIPDHRLPAQMRIQFSEPGKNAWRDAGILRRDARTATTYRLAIGKRYDLRGSTDGGATWPYISKNAHVNKASWYFALQDLGYCQ